MQKVWELVAAKNGGIPSQILVLEEPSLAARGWGWAPKSLLNSQHSSSALSTRLVRWADHQLGQLTELGLRVKYPGYRISCRQDYGDGKLPHPWPWMPRIPEDWLQFHDKETGKWYRIVEKKFAALSKTWSDEERQRYHTQELFPLHDMAETGRSVLIRRTVGEVYEGLFATTEEGGEDDKNSNGVEGLPVSTRYHIYLQELRGESYVYEVTKRLALQLRADPMTDAHLALYKRLVGEEHASPESLKALLEKDGEFKASIQGLRDKMKEITAETIRIDERFKDAVKTNFGESFLEKIWVLIQDFFNHDITSERLNDEQVWFVS